MAWFNFKKTRQPTPGALDNAFYPGFSLPPQALRSPSLSQGKAVNVNWDWRPFQPPQMYYGAKQIPTTGLGGIVAGTIYGQPLVNTPLG